MSHKYQAESNIDIGQLTRVIFKGYAYAVFGLLVVVDGLNNAESFETRLLTIPYFIGGLSLTRSIGEALDSHHDFHAALFSLGLSTLSALA